MHIGFCYALCVRQPEIWSNVSTNAGALYIVTKHKNIEHSSICVTRSSHMRYWITRKTFYDTILLWQKRKHKIHKKFFLSSDNYYSFCTLSYIIIREKFYFVIRIIPNINNSYSWKNISSDKIFLCNRCVCLPGIWYDSIYAFSYLKSTAERICFPKAYYIL